METVLISACLVGDKCRYDGKGKYNPMVKEIMQKYDLLPICPETLGGLKTPRDPSEIKGDKGKRSQTKLWRSHEASPNRACQWYFTASSHFTCKITISLMCT